MKLTPAASILTSACPGAGAGCDTSRYSRASGPPGVRTWMAFMTTNYVEKRRRVNTLRDGVERPRTSYRSGRGLSYSRQIIFKTRAVLLARELTLSRRPNPARCETWRSDSTSWADPRIQQEAPKLRNRPPPAGLSQVGRNGHRRPPH